ncbi:MAG: hypothetical protein OCD01_12470 [Fibrobacterales bacterium]
MTMLKTIKKALTFSTLSYMAITPAWSQTFEEAPIENVSYDEQIGVEEDDSPSISTSKPHHLPKLLQMKTAKVLESYSIGINGSGNIHDAISNFSMKKLYGSIAIGLGDIIELGYQYDPYHSDADKLTNYFNGYMKLQVINETKNFPLVSVSAGSNVSKTFRNKKDIRYQIERQFVELMLAKQFSTSNHIFNIYPGVKYTNDRITETSVPNPIEKEFGAGAIEGGIGLTWQESSDKLFIYECNYITPVNAEHIEESVLSHSRLIENLFGVRFYVQNWLFIDSGIKHSYKNSIKEGDLSVNVNFSGVLPLKSIAQRLF